MRLPIPLFLLLVLSYGMPAQAASLFDDKEARRGVAELKLQVTDLQAQLAELKTRLAGSEAARQTLEKQLVDIEAFGKRQAFDQLGHIDRLNAEISLLRGQLEMNGHNIGQSQQRQKDLYVDLDARLRKLESMPIAAIPPTESSMALPGQSSQPAVPVDSAAELKSYESAHELFKAGKYKESAEAFEKFLEAFPNGKYTPNAYYWLGYAHFSQKNYKAAIAGQQKLISLYPDNQKVPDAMYNIANSQIQLSEVEDAKKTLRTLLEKYPQSDAAPLAKKRLAVLESIKSR